MAKKKYSLRGFAKKCNELKPKRFIIDSTNQDDKISPLSYKVNFCGIRITPELNTILLYNYSNEPSHCLFHNVTSVVMDEYIPGFGYGFTIKSTDGVPNSKVNWNYYCVMSR